MILYHGTTIKRATKIMKDKSISNDCERFFTRKKNGEGYTTQGYVYLSNEITYALYFANCHHFVDQSEQLCLFRVIVPDELLEADFDEMRHQDPTGHHKQRYNSDLECSLLEFKTCRVPFPIDFSKYEVSYFIIDLTNYSDFSDLLDNAGYDREYVINHYNSVQMEFIKSIKWRRCST